MPNVVIYRDLSPQDRYVYIEREEPEVRSFKYKLARFFCCCCCFTSVRPVARRWDDHRIYLINNRPAYGTQEYIVWERAAIRVNRMVPWYRSIPLHRPRPVVVQQPVFVPQSIGVQPIYVPSYPSTVVVTPPPVVVTPAPRPIIVTPPPSPMYTGPGRPVSAGPTRQPVSPRPIAPSRSGGSRPFSASQPVQRGGTLMANNSPSFGGGRSSGLGGNGLTRVNTAALRQMGS